MIVVMFGLAGAGKNYVGQLLEKQTNCYFWDADEAISEEMKHCIQKKIPFSQEIRDQYFNIVMERAQELHLEHENIIISQAFYKNKNREEFLTRFPKAIFIQVSASFETILHRLRERNDMIDAEYARKISINFEVPTHEYSLIDNEGGDINLLDQLRDIHQLSSLFEKKYEPRKYKGTARIIRESNFLFFGGSIQKPNSGEQEIIKERSAPLEEIKIADVTPPNYTPTYEQFCGIM